MDQRINIYQIQLGIFRKHRLLSLSISLLVYAGIILLFGPRLRVSANYLVALPVIAFALGYGKPGGLLAGTLGLPANLALFALIGHPEFSPESKTIAEIFGIIVGGSLGALSDYFHQLNREIVKGKELAKKLEEKVADREVLIQEVHHRVKNNLTLVLSLMQLQRHQHDSPEFQQAMDMVSSRIRAIASVHEFIYSKETSTAVNLQRHIPSLCQAVIDSYHIPGLSLRYDVQFRSGLPIEKATPLSLIILEIITNSCKHAFCGGEVEPSIFVIGRETEEDFVLIISDNGRGCGFEMEHPEGQVTTEVAQRRSSRLGTTIINALAKQIRAEVILNTETGYEYVIKFRRPEKSPS